MGADHVLSQQREVRNNPVSNGATAACASFTEAQGTCTTTGGGNGAFLSGPSTFVQVIALALVLMASRE